MIAFTGEYDGNPMSMSSRRRRSAEAADVSPCGRIRSPAGHPMARRFCSPPWANSFCTSKISSTPYRSKAVSRRASAADRRRCFVLSRRDAPGLRPSSQVAASLEAVSGRPNHARSGLPSSKTPASSRMPRENSNDHHPMWIGDTIYFLSDRNGPVSLFAYDTRTKQVSEALQATDSTSRLLRLDRTRSSSSSSAQSSCTISRLARRRRSPFEWRAISKPFVRTSRRSIPSAFKNFGISPTGARAIFEAWGEIFTVPTDKGDIRNLTHSPATADRDPSGRRTENRIAYFTDESGEYELAHS